MWPAPPGVLSHWLGGLTWNGRTASISRAEALAAPRFSTR